MCVDSTERRLLTGSADGVLRLWNYSSGQMLYEMPTGPSPKARQRIERQLAASAAAASLADDDPQPPPPPPAKGTATSSDKASGTRAGSAGGGRKSPARAEAPPAGSPPSSPTAAASGGAAASGSGAGSPGAPTTTTNEAAPSYGDLSSEISVCLHARQSPIDAFICAGWTREVSMFNNQGYHKYARSGCVTRVALSSNALLSPSPTCSMR